MKKALIVFLAASLMTACNNEKSNAGEGGVKKANDEKTDANAAPSAGRWSNEERTKFIDACIPQTAARLADSAKARSYCTCMQQQMEAKYPVSDSVVNVSINEVMSLAKNCIE